MSDPVDRWHVKRAPDGAERCKEHKLHPSAKHGQGKRWAARYRDDRGVQRSPTFTRRTDAANHLTKVSGDLLRGEYVNTREGRTKLEDYAKTWLAAQTFDESTREAFDVRLRLHILPTFGGHELRAIQASAVQAWIKGLQGSLAPNYVKVILTSLSTVLNAAVEDRKIARNPCAARSVKAPSVGKKRVVPWAREWVAGTRAALPVEYREMVTVGAGIGLRQGEIFGLAVEDIDWLRKVVHVRRQVKVVGGRLVFAPPKRDKERDVPLPDTVSLRLAKHLQDSPAETVTLPWRVPAGKPHAATLLFTSPRGALNRNAFNTSWWKPALRAAGVPDTRENGMHALRHCFASVVLDGGASIAALAAWLGHASPGFTLSVYCHLLPATDERMRNAIDEAFTAGSDLGGAPHVRQAND